MKSSTFGDLSRSGARKVLERMLCKNNWPVLALAVLVCAGIVLGLEWLLEGAALLFLGLAFWRSIRHDRDSRIYGVANQLPSPVESQVLQGEVDENHKNRFAATNDPGEPDLIGPFVLGIGLLVVIASPTVALWQSYSWLKSGIWPDIIVGDAWQWAGLKIKSTEWLGLDKIINLVIAVPLWLCFLVIGLLIAWLGIGITNLINARYYALQMRRRLDRG